jgi:membrane protease YdiL (CAAX protease family)
MLTRIWTFIKFVFWNIKEKRMRALWRLFSQNVLNFILLFIFEIVHLLGRSLLAILRGEHQSSVFLPYSSIDELLNYPMLLTGTFLISGLAIIISIWVVGQFLDRRKFADFGLRLNRNWWIDFLFGFGLGAGLMGLIFLIEISLGWITITKLFHSEISGTPFYIAIIIPIVLYISVGFYEELLSRGYRLINISEGLSGKYIGPRVAILLATLISSINFGVMHASNPNATFISTFNIIIAGIFLSTAFILTGQLAIPIGIHISWNFFQGNVFGFPVSGLNFHAASFIDIKQHGPTLWTGGLFGPEAGLISVFAMLVGILLTIWWIKRRYHGTSLFLPIASHHQSELVESNQ